MNQLANFSYDPAKCSLATSLFKALQTIEPAIPEGLTVVDFFKTLEQPPEKALGDYALPCFRFAKAIKKNPNEVATELKRILEEEKNPWVDSIVLKGAFLNIFTNQKEVAKALVPTLVNGSGFNILKSNPDHNKTKVMIEFSQPNTHKEFHVGHGRNVCIGDSICRIFTYNGYKVIGVNYIGDEGTHIAKCLWGVKHYTGSDKVEDQSNKAEWLGQRYVEANNKIKDAADNVELTTQYHAEVGEILKAI